VTVEGALPQVDVCCIGAHPDDVELSMGGTIAGMVRAGVRVGLLDLTDGEPTPYGTHELRMREAAAAAEALGVTWRHTLPLPNRALQDTLEARRGVAEVLRAARPRVLFTHHPEDAHPDHVAAASLVLAARFWSKLVKTDMAGTPHYPARVYHFQAAHERSAASPSFIVDVSLDMERKRAALACYASQFSANPNNAQFMRFVDTSASYFGGLARVEAGEPFFAREPIAIARVMDLL
jgi:N-acetylglucosamine malate deacetylase 1